MGEAGGAGVWVRDYGLIFLFIGLLYQNVIRPDFR